MPQKAGEKYFTDFNYRATGNRDDGVQVTQSSVSLRKRIDSLIDFALGMNMFGTECVHFLAEIGN